MTFSLEQTFRRVGQQLEIGREMGRDVALVTTKEEVTTPSYVLQVRMNMALPLVVLLKMDNLKTNYIMRKANIS